MMVEAILTLIANCNQKEIEQVMNSVNSMMNRQTEDEHYMNRKQVCQYLNKCNNTVTKYMKMGLPYLKINKSYLFNKNEIDEWLASKNI